jgi:hypothetical protein
MPRCDAAFGVGVTPAIVGFAPHPELGFFTGWSGSWGEV